MELLGVLQHAAQGRLVCALSASHFCNKTYKHTRKHKSTKHNRQPKKTKRLHSQRSQTQTYNGHLYSYAKKQNTKQKQTPEVQVNISSIPKYLVYKYIQSSDMSPGVRTAQNKSLSITILSTHQPTILPFCFSLQICSGHSLRNPNPRASKSTNVLALI